jgi:HD-GYP domain-containing protein (c-di-GMP phosphodiesterase class II)
VIGREAPSGGSGSPTVWFASLVPSPKEEWRLVRGHPWDQVPLDARILGVADAYEAITSDRPYRGALAADDAAAVLRDGAGRQFDAQVVDALLRAV